MIKDALVRTCEARTRPAACSRLSCLAALGAAVGSLLLATPVLAGTNSEPEPSPESEPEPAPDAESKEDEHPRSAVFIALGGGFQQVSTRSYAAFGGEVGFALIGPLWFSVDAQVSLSPNAPCFDGTADDDGCTAVFTTIRPGPVFRFDGKVEAHVHAGFVLGINGPHPSYLPVMPGFEIGGGVEVGKGPVAIRPRAAFRLFGPLVEGGPPNPGFLVGVDAVLRLGKRR